MEDLLHISGLITGEGEVLFKLVTVGCSKGGLLKEKKN